MPHVPRNIQSPNTATDFWNKWNSVNPRMALFVKVTSAAWWAGAAAIGFTSNTRNMTLPGHPGVTFHSAPGITPSVIEQALGEAVNLELLGVYKTGLFEQADVIAGKWSYASVEVFSACWDNTNLGELVHFTGNVGEFTDFQQSFRTEARGKIARLSNNVNKQTQRLCRVKDFRDAECGHTASTVTIGGTPYNIVQTDIPTVISPPPNRGAIYLDVGFFGGNVPPAGFFTNGKITGTSGNNNGISREVAHSTGLNNDHIKIALKRPFPYLNVAVADTFTIVAGCVRTIEDCRKYSNTANFRGEPYVPGIEAANRIPSGS